MTRAREYWLQAQDRWPALQQLLACYLNQAWPQDHGTPEAAIKIALDEADLEARKQVCREWWSWNAELGSQPDSRRALNEGLGVDVHFDNEAEARAFMNSVYDRAIISIRREAGKDWKP